MILVVTETVLGAGDRTGTSVHHHTAGTGRRGDRYTPFQAVVTVVTGAWGHLVVAACEQRNQDDQEEGGGGLTIWFYRFYRHTHTLSLSHSLTHTHTYI